MLNLRLALIKGRGTDTSVFASHHADMMREGLISVYSNKIERRQPYLTAFAPDRVFFSPILMTE
jgi:hypothetical protein